MPAQIKHILFDLGNVLVDIHPEFAMREFARECQQPYSEIQKFFLSPLHLEFMKGELSAHQFYESISKRYACPIGYNRFLEIWAEVIGVAKPGMEEIVRELAEKDFQLSVCSNTDPLHWEVAKRQSDMFRYFSHYFLSFEMHLLKPQPEFFKDILNSLDARAEECLFIDDTPENVSVANRFRFHTLCAHTSEAVRVKLLELGLF